MTTREQLRVCGELTDYSHEEIEELIKIAKKKRSRADDETIYTAVLAWMRSDHKSRSVEQFKRSLGVIK